MTDDDWRLVIKLKGIENIKWHVCSYFEMMEDPGLRDLSVGVEFVDDA